MNKIILKPTREKNILKKNHWIFSGAIANNPRIDPGELAPVLSSTEEMLGWGYFNPKCSLIGHMVSFGNQDPYVSLKNNIQRALLLRRSLLNQSTNAYRLINSEGDNLPGLIVDRYDKLLVIQIGTLGMEKLKFFLIEELKKQLPEITSIYEKSTLPSRALEGLADFEDFIYGERIPLLTILENGVKFLVDIQRGQKTGLFLDQRAMREFVGKLSQGKKVINFFSYTGGFSLYAALNGALSVTSIDISKSAIELARKNFEINNLNAPAFTFVEADAAQFIKHQPLNYDLVILDPPAFAKKRKDLPQALKGYENLNSSVLAKIPSNSLLLTCSCSRYVSTEMFDQILYRSTLKSNREVFRISRHLQAFDHPINIQHPEADYLKSALLYIK